jgi:drug/metabolite transporter (DMT)-like permease
MIKIGLFSALYSINIAMSNVSMKYVSLAFHQVTRSATPIITLTLEYFILGKVTGVWCVASLIPVMAGIVLTVFGEFKGMELTGLGLFLTIFGIVLSSLKGVLTNFLLVSGFKMHPLELIALIGPFASLQCLISSILTGESSSIYTQYRHNSFDGLLVFGLIINGTLAFLMNWISFAANKETSALAMTVAGNVKQAVSIGFSVILFGTKLHLIDGIGIFITLLGGAWYR